MFGDDLTQRLAGGETWVWQTPLTVPFRGLTHRDGLLLQGSIGWGDFSPFWDYDDAAAAPWLACAWESAELGWPVPVRETVPVNVIVPAVAPEKARELVFNGGRCRTVKVKVAQKLANGELEPLESELARVTAVRDALDTAFGKGNGKIRVDANGAWSVAQALTHLRELNAAAGGLEYVEQPCATVEQLAELRQALVRAKIEVLVAADESIRRAVDPFQVKELAAADIVVLKVAPLGGVRACLRLAAEIGLPVVVSSALESSIGLAAGLALAGALPDLPFACGLATASLLKQDVIAQPLAPVNGELPVLRSGDPRLTPRSLGEIQFGNLASEPPELAIGAEPPPKTEPLAVRWQARLSRVAPLLGPTSMEVP